MDIHNDKNKVRNATENICRFEFRQATNQLIYCKRTEKTFFILLYVLLKTVQNTSLKYWHYTYEVYS